MPLPDDRPQRGRRTTPIRGAGLDLQRRRRDSPAGQARQDAHGSPGRRATAAGRLRLAANRARSISNNNRELTPDSQFGHIGVRQDSSKDGKRGSSDSGQDRRRSQSPPHTPTAGTPRTVGHKGRASLAPTSFTPAQLQAPARARRGRGVSMRGKAPPPRPPPRLPPPARSDADPLSAIVADREQRWFRLRMARWQLAHEEWAQMNALFRAKAEIQPLTDEDRERIDGFKWPARPMYHRLLQPNEMRLLLHDDLGLGGVWDGFCTPLSELRDGLRRGLLDAPRAEHSSQPKPHTVAEKAKAGGAAAGKDGRPPAIPSHGTMRRRPSGDGAATRAGRRTTPPSAAATPHTD
eukprot:gene36061-31948_t